LSFSYDLYAQIEKAAVYLAPDLGSIKIFELEKGTKVTGIEQKGYWHKVAYKGKKGWIYRFLVKTMPPVNGQDVYGKISSQTGQYEDFANRARRRPSAYSSAAAARGLNEGRLRFSAKYRLDYEALEKMEAVAITDSEAREFLGQGVAK